MQNKYNRVAKTVVVGGGLTGLFTAWLLAEKQECSNLVVIERENEVGGLLRSFDYGENGRFDYGAHYMAETGNEVIDDMQKSLLPEDEWNPMQGNRRDLGGIIWKNDLQHQTPYLDLRQLPENEFREAVGDYFLNLNKKKEIPTSGSAWDVASALFGEVIAEKHIAPVLKRIYHKDIRELDSIVLRLTPLLRVAFLDEDLVEDVTSSKTLQPSLAFTEQRNLPADRSSGKSSFYPKNFGMFRVIDAMVQRLTKLGVTILTDTTITGMNRKNGQISSIQAVQNGRAMTIKTSQIYWTVNMMALTRVLDLGKLNLDTDRPQKTVIVNLLLKEKPKALGDLFYCYSYAPGGILYRISNYTEYCPKAKRAGGWPISLEMQVPGQVDEVEITQVGINEIIAAGVIKSHDDVAFAKAEILTGGFPMPTLKNMKALETIRNLVVKQNIENLTLLGILSEPGIFFQVDVLTQAYGKIIAEQVVHPLAA